MVSLNTLLKSYGAHSKKVNLVLSQCLVGVVGLISGKLIALSFSPEEFGAFNLEFGIYSFFFSLLVSPFLQFVKSSCKTLLPKLGFKVYLNLAAFLIALVIASIAVTFGLSYPHRLSFVVFFIILIPLNLVSNLLIDYFNVNNQLGLFSLASLCKSICGLLVLIVFYLLNSELGSPGLWIVQLVGFLSSSIFFLNKFKVRYATNLKVSMSRFFRKFIMYAWPLVILAFWNWINNFSDRYIIEFFMDVKDVGIYNANYSLGSKFFILINPLFLSLLMPKIYANTTNEIKKIAINRAVKMYFLVGVPLLILIYYLREPLGLVLLSKEYSSGYYIIFWIAFAYFFLTLTYLYETIFYYNGNTKIILYSNITSAVINIIFNMVLIKLFGLPGAIISMMLSCIVRVLIIRSYFVRV